MAESLSTSAPSFSNRQWLDTARYIAAPMVNQSDLPWRLLLRRYNPQTIVYTQMILCDQFVSDPIYRREMLLTCSHDRPLIVQFGGNSTASFVEASKLVAPYCDAIDLNLGCPQRAARSGLYGAYLLDEEHHHRIFEMIAAFRADALLANKPLCVKTRLLPTLEESVAFHIKLAQAGIDVLTIHGRTRGFVEERRKGPADLESIRHVFGCIRKQQAVEIIKHGSSSTSSQTPGTIKPSLRLWTNGNVRCDADVERNIAFTGADGCMVGEAILNDPTIFRRCKQSIAHERKEGEAVSTQSPSISSGFPQTSGLDTPVVALLSEFSPNSLLIPQELHRRYIMIAEYLAKIQQTTEIHTAPFAPSTATNDASSAGVVNTPENNSVSSSSFVVDDRTFLTPIVSWSSFHSHLYHILNSDHRCRFLYHAQMIDEFLDATSIGQLKDIMEELQGRIDSNREFDIELQREIDANRSARQQKRASIHRQQIAREAVQSGREKPMNSKERKRARWKQRKEDEKRRKLEDETESSSAPK